MPITDHVYEDGIDGLCKASVPGRQGDRDFCDQPPEEHERPKIDPDGTCHLVGCVGKGIHGPEGPHSKPEDPPSAALPSMLRDPYHRTVIRQKIGATETWAPYEGGPLIPKPDPEADYCLGFPKVWSGNGKLFITCSIHPAGWFCEWPDGFVVSAGALVDQHKTSCTNRRAT